MWEFCEANASAKIGIWFLCYLVMLSVSRPCSQIIGQLINVEQLAERELPGETEVL
jgi:hypothetical protein